MQAKKKKNGIQIMNTNHTSKFTEFNSGKTCYKKTLSKPETSFKVAIIHSSQQCNYEFTCHKVSNNAEDDSWRVTNSCQFQEFLDVSKRTKHQKRALQAARAAFMRQSAQTRGLILIETDQIYYASFMKPGDKLPTRRISMPNTRSSYITNAKRKMRQIKKEERNRVHGYPPYVAYLPPNVQDVEKV